VGAFTREPAKIWHYDRGPCWFAYRGQFFTHGNCTFFHIPKE